MRGIIDERGFLRIYRGDSNPNHYQQQYCPFQNKPLEGDMKECGTWCPKFENHYKAVEFKLVFTDRKSKILNLIFGPIKGFKKIETGKTIQKICHNQTLIFNEFKSEI